MNYDPESLKDQEEQERQDRRQFLNGLGKWSLAVIAAVTGLRGPAIRDMERETRWWPEIRSKEADDSSQRIARHGDTPHGDQKYTKYGDNGWHLDSTKHQDFPHKDHRLMAPQREQRRPSGEPLKKMR